MNISNPSLTLRFIAESATETISSDYIGIHSIAFKEQLLRELKSSSNSVTLQIADDCPYIENILQASGDVSAVFKDGNTVLFTGYLSDNHKWVITDRGTQALSITIEDVGTKLLGKTFLTNSVSSEHVFDDYINASSSHSIVKEVCDAAGITMAPNTPVITVKAVKSIGRDTTCKQILDTMLYEAGYAYYFTNEGKLNLYEINCVSTSGLPQLNSNSLYVVDGNAITLTKKVKQYKQANINWTSLEYRDNVRVYEDISGQSSTYPHCNISIPTGKSYPDEDGNIAKTEASDLEKGNELVYISDITPDISVVAGQYTSSITQIGSKAIGVLITNTGVETVEVRKLQATADICCVKAKNVTVAGETVDVDESKNLYKYDAEYIHDGDSAKRLANLIVNYHKYCNYTYTFYSKVSYASGTLVNIVDDMYSGLDTNVLIIGRSYNDSTDVIQYTAVAISPFALTAEVYTDSTITAPTVIPGPVGNGIVNIYYYYAATSTQTQPDPADITSPTIPVMDPDINKYLWQKTVTEYTDGNTKTNVSLLSVYGDESYEFRLKVTPTNFVQDRRRTDTQTVTIEAVIIGYSGTPTISYYFAEEGPESIHSVQATTVTVTIPYNNSYSSMNIQATLTGAPPQSLNVIAVDKTSKYEYFGAFSIDTSDYFDNGTFVPENYVDVDWTPLDSVLATNQTFLDGDSFFNNYTESGFEDYYIYTYENGVWKPVSYSNFSNSIKSRICAQAQEDVLSTIEPGSVVKSDYGYFNDIITGTVTADYIGGKEIEVRDGGFIYGGDVDISQPAGHRVGATNAGFCFDSLGNAEVSNIRVTGESTIEGGSTVLGTLINYDSDNKPVFKTVKQAEANVSIAGSKTDGSSAPAAYLWSSLTQWLRNTIVSAASSGTYYTASGTINANWAGSITSRTIIGLKYWSSVPTATNSNTVHGSSGAGTSETKTMYTNNNAYIMTFSQITCHPKTKSSIWGETGYGELKCVTYNANGTVYQTLCDAGETSGTGGAGMIYLYNVNVPPGGYIVAEAGTYSGFPWGSWDTDLYLTFNYKESDMFSSGINYIVSDGVIYSYNSVMPDVSTFSTSAQVLTCSSLSLSLNLTMTAASTWPVEKYYRFTYSTAPSSSATVTASIFNSQSFSFRGVSKTVSSITYSNTYLKVIATDGTVFEFYTTAGNYFPRHSFSFTTLGQSLGAYTRSVLPTDDPNTHNVGAAGSYDSGVSQRWNNGFFESVDVSTGLMANTINANYVTQGITTATNIGAIPSGSVKLVKSNASGVTISFAGTCLVIEFIGTNNVAVSTVSSSYTTSSSGLILFVRL